MKKLLCRWFGHRYIFVPSTSTCKLGIMPAVNGYMYCSRCNVTHRYIFNDVHTINDALIKWESIERRVHKSMIK